MSETQLALWQWINALPDGVFTPRAAVEALHVHARTIAESIKKLVTMDKLERLGEGRGTRYRLKK